MQLSFFGKFTGLRTKLNKYMDTCAENCRSLLLTCKQISFGIFGYSGRDGDVEYCLFDPHGRNSNGYFDYSAKSCILYFKSIDALINLLVRDEIFTHCTYECVPIEKRPTNSNDRGHLVRIHNSRGFVDAYLDARDEWTESSGSSDTEDGDSYNIEDDCDLGTLNGAGDKFAGLKSTAGGRHIKAPQRYECESHPSFFRGKLREDQKRLKGKWKKWYDAQDPEQRRIINLRKRRLWRFNQLNRK